MSDTLIELDHVSKAFGQFQAVSDVCLRVSRGQTLGLVGDNGAGKSTVIKLLAGVHRPDAGRVLYGGQPVALSSPKAARRLGIETVFQDLALVDELSIARNFFLGAERKRRIGPLRLLDLRMMRAETQRYLEDIGINRLRSPDETVAFLSGGERQAIAIARAMYFGASLIILDEPTSALSIKEARKVLEYVRLANERDIAVVVISHNVRHVIPVADHVAVMHHGTVAGTYARGDTDEDHIETLITEGPDGAAAGPKEGP